MDDIAGSKYFLDVQSDKAIYRDQNYLATFGAWNRFKLQFRYDEIPHTYTNTARTLYTQTSPGVSPFHFSHEVRYKGWRASTYASQHDSEPVGAGDELHRSRISSAGREPRYSL